MAMKFNKSAARVKAASRYVAGGVNSNFRAGISPTPLVVQRSEGAYLIDADGNRLIDYYLGMGAILLGHNPKPVVDAIRAQLAHGILYAAQSEIEYEAAELFCKLIPCAERVRFNSSGSEVVQAVFRLARAATRRPTIVKFEGHYHGWFDNIAWSTAPGPSERGNEDDPAHIPATPGMAPHADAGLDVVVWNDLERLRKRLLKRDVAAVIMEPAMCNTSAIHPAPGYLEGVRKLCDETGTILVFDEVITGFRLGLAGAQGWSGISPDLSIFGKVVGGGLPLAAVGGSAGLMDELAPTGPVYQAGTLSGNPLATAAGLAVLGELTDDSYVGLERTAARLADGLGKAFAEADVAAQVTRARTLVGVFFTEREVRDYDDARTADQRRYASYFHRLLDDGIYVAPSAFETLFPSLAHSDATIDRTIEAAAAAALAISAG